MKNIKIVTHQENVHLFFPLLQHGFRMETSAGESVKDFLIQNCSLNDEYIESRLKTVFLDGKPVDDIEKGALTDGAVLALSSAMPGLAGTTLRRGGHLAVFRSGITHQNKNDEAGSGNIMIRVKLFNLVIKDVGVKLLAKGIILDQEAVKFLPNIKEGVSIDDIPDKSVPGDIPAGTDFVCLSVQFQ